MGRAKRPKVTSKNTVYFMDDRTFQSSITFRLPADVKEGLMQRIQYMYDGNIIPRRIMAPAFFRAFTMAFLDHPKYFMQVMRKYL